jgi:hypothetical protein
VTVHDSDSPSHSDGQSDGMQFLELSTSHDEATNAFKDGSNEALILWLHLAFLRIHLQQKKPKEMVSDSNLLGPTGHAR